MSRDASSILATGRTFQQSSRSYVLPPISMRQRHLRDATTRPRENSGQLEPMEWCLGVTSLNWKHHGLKISSVPVNGLFFGRDSRILSTAEPRTGNIRRIRFQLPLLKVETARSAGSTYRGNNHRTFRSRTHPGSRYDKPTRVSRNRTPPIYRRTRA